MNHHIAKHHRSFWLDQLLTDFRVQPALSGDHKTDIAIIGGGYVGLWTAIRIKEQDPACEVTVLEQDFCGSGASGRNGGFALSWWPKLSSLVALLGENTAIELGRDSEQAILEINEFMAAHGLEVDFRKSEWLWTATSNSQRGAWNSVAKLCARLKLDIFKDLSESEVQRRTGSSAHIEGVLETSAATLHPGKLALGLREIALQRGVKIFENTTVRRFTRTRPCRLETDGGVVRCDKLVIATNAWAAAIKELAASIVAITSDMIVTEPIGQRLREIGWTGGECITDSQTMVDYYHVTKDERIAFGKGGWGIAFGGHLGADFDRNIARAQTVEKDFRRYYPRLNDVRITHDWCGPIDRTPTSLPLLGKFSKAEHIIYGVGWSGNGVGPSVIGGKVLAGLALGVKNKWSEYPLVQKDVGRFPPEPIRYIGAHAVRTAVAIKERYEIENRRPPLLAVSLAKFAPAGIEDKAP